MTNKFFTTHDRYFKQACKLAKTKPTIRQASKYRNGKGSAIWFKRLAVTMINQEIINEQA